MRRAIAFAVAGGLLTAFLLFALTARPNNVLCCPVGWSVIDYGGTDPWTGEVRPVTLSAVDEHGNRSTVVNEPPHSLVIPLPVGFAVGCLLIAVVLRPRNTPPRAPRSGA